MAHGERDVSAAEESLREGKLEDTLAQLQEQVRKHPAEARHRVFLFQLLAVLGRWDKALTQLSVAGELDASTLAMVNMYGSAVQCELLREKVFAGERSPMFFGEPEEWMALMVEALRLGAQGSFAESQSVRERAFEAAPATAGSIDGHSFAWIADADPRLGPLLEAIINGRYYWIPFQNIARMDIEEPADLRDMVWTPAHFTWANGGQTVGLIPSRYPDSERSADAAIRLGRKTEWLQQHGELYFGAGQRMLATDQAEYPLMEVRVIRLDDAGPDAQPPEASPGDGLSSG